MANYFDQFDESTGQASKPANYFDQFDETKSGSAQDDGNFTRGFKNSFRQLPQLGYGIEAIAGATGEKLAGPGGLFTGIKQHGLKNYQQEAVDLAPYSKDNDSITTAWEKAKGGDIGALGDFAGHGLGYVAGQGLQALATAGVGKLLAQQGVKAVAPSVIESLTAKEAAKLAGEEAAKGLTAAEIQQIAAKNALAKVGKYGANTALAANALGMEGGEIGGGMVANAEQRGTPLTGEELLKGGLSTLAAGGLEYLGDKIGIDAAFGKMPIGKALSNATGVSGRVGRGLASGAIAAAPEAGTEYGQTMLEQYGQGQDPFSAESQRQAIDAAALGALGGQAMGGVGGVMSSPEVVEKPISDGPLGNAAAAGGITKTETNDADSINSGIIQPGQTADGVAANVLPDATGVNATGAVPFNVDLSGSAESNNPPREATGDIPLTPQSNIIYGESPTNAQNPETPVQTETSQSQASTTGELQPTESAVSQSFAPTHELDDRTPVRLAQDSDGPYFEAADGQQFDFTPSATPLETPNADNTGSNASTNDQAATDASRGIGDGESATAAGTGVAGSGDVSGRTSGDDRQLPGGELPSNVESGGALRPSSVINTQYLSDNGVSAEDVSRIERAIDNNPGIARNAETYVQKTLENKYPDLDFSQVFNVSAKQQSTNLSDSATAQPQSDAGYVSSQPGAVDGQAPEIQPVLPNGGTDQTGNAASMGVGQAPSGVSSDEWSQKIVSMKAQQSTEPAGDLPSADALKNNVHSNVKTGEFKSLGNYLGNKEGAIKAGFYDGILPVNAENNFNRVVDVFGGSGLVTGLVKKSSNIPIVMNDGDENTVNFHRQIQANPEAVKAKAVAYREQAAKFQAPTLPEQDRLSTYKTWWKDQDGAAQQAGDIDRAAWTFFKNTSFGRERSIPALVRSEVKPSVAESRIDGHASTLNGVDIQNKDAAKLLDEMGEGDLVNLDPPYTPEENAKTVSGYDYQGEYNLEVMGDSKDKTGNVRKGKLSWINEKVIPAAQRGAGIIYTDNADTRIVEVLKQAGFYVKLQRPNNSKRIELIAWNSPVASAVSGGIRQSTSGSVSKSDVSKPDAVMGGNISQGREPGRMATRDATGNQAVPDSGTGAAELRGRGDVKFSIANQPSITALFDQLGKLKSAEKANKDTQALVNAHPQAERIRHVQNYWTDILVQHEKTSDNPNGKVTIQC